MSDIQVDAGTLYEINKQVLANSPAMKEQELKDALVNISDWLSTKIHNQYFMLLCRERNDYNIFNLKAPKYYDAIKELKELLQSRGEIIGINYVHGTDAYECWVRKDEEVFMFLFFECDWMVLEIE